MAFIPTESTSPQEWLDGVFADAFERGASDIFIDALYDENDEIVSLNPELRVDGWNISEQALTDGRASQVIVIIKNSAEMGTSKLNEPQEGRFPLTWRGSELAPVDKPELLDVRVTIFPTVLGEFISMRIPPTGSLPDLETLGLSDYNRSRLDVLLARPSGLIELAGPMGSGKTTTMYSVMKIIGGDRKSVVTVEDPKERTLDGARQLAINPRGGMTYAAVLKSLLRVVMDAMLIGEIRDQDTASAAVKFATSGTKVLSSIHSGDPVSAIARTIDLSGAGVIATMEAINGIVSQRLIRTFHDFCKGKGCDGCEGTGYKGRMPVHEVLINSAEITEAMLRGAPRAEVHQIARDQGMISFHEDADRLLEMGLTDERQIEESIGFDIRKLSRPSVIDVAAKSVEQLQAEDARAAAAQQAAATGQSGIPEESARQTEPTQAPQAQPAQQRPPQAPQQAPQQPAQVQQPLRPAQPIRATTPVAPIQAPQQQQPAQQPVRPAAQQPQPVQPKQAPQPVQPISPQTTAQPKQTANIGTSESDPMDWLNS